MMLRHSEPTEVPLEEKPPSWISRPTLAAYLKYKVPIPWDEIDEGCKKLIHALTPLPGVTTTSSCSGHGRTEFHVAFIVADQQDLLPILYFSKKCHNGSADWRVEVDTDCSMHPISFMLMGPSEDVATADAIADRLERYYNQVVDGTLKP